MEGMILNSLVNSRFNSFLSRHCGQLSTPTKINVRQNDSLLQTGAAENPLAIALPPSSSPEKNSEGEIDYRKVFTQLISQ